MKMRKTFVGGGVRSVVFLVAFFVLFGFGWDVNAQTAPPDVTPDLPEIPSFPVEPTLDFSASPESVPFGTSTTLSWTSTDAANCVASGSWSGSKAISGIETVSPSSDAVYTLTCSDVFHVVSTERSVSVTVVDGPDTTVPTKPLGLIGTIVASSEVDLSWTASSDPIVVGQETSGIREYQIERCQGSGCVDFVQIGVASETNYADKGLSSQTLYRYRVRAVDGSGNVSAFSSIVKKSTPALAKPTSFVATVVSSSQIDLLWTASTDPGVSEYRIERCQGSSCVDFAQIGVVSETTYSDTGLSPNTLYRYRVRAADGSGNVSGYTTVLGRKTLAS